DNGLRNPLYLHLEDERGNTAVTRVTTNHKYWVPARGWTAAEDLNLGDVLRSYHGDVVRVTDKFLSDELLPTYNLCIAEAHTYFIGKLPVRVHNDSDLLNLGQSQYTTEQLTGYRMPAYTPPPMTPEQLSAAAKGHVQTIVNILTPEEPPKPAPISLTPKSPY